MSTSEHLRQIKRLLIALGFSGFLNVIFLALLIDRLLEEKPAFPYFEPKPASHHSSVSPLSAGNVQVIRHLRTCSFEKLKSLLSSKQMIENGYDERNLALACLVSFHHLDLTRALGSTFTHLQQRTITYGKHANGALLELTVYPGLSEENWEAILDFIGRERWPQTPEGQLVKLRQQGEEAQTSLVDAFALTQEFQTVQALFARAPYSVEKMELIQLLVTGDWQLLAHFTAEQCQEQDLSEQKRCLFLLNYIDKGSSIAACLLLKTDLPFAIKKLDDARILQMLALLDEKSPDSEKFARALLRSPRSDQVWKAAATRLQEFGVLQKHSLCPQIDKMMSLSPIAPKASIKGIEKLQVISDQKVPVRVKPSAKPLPLSGKERLYIIQEGDSLWKISRRFNIDVELLRHHNRLSSDVLKPGEALRIPTPISSDSLSKINDTP